MFYVWLSFNLFQRLKSNIWTYRSFRSLYTYWPTSILWYFTVSCEPNLLLLLMSHTKIWSRYQYIIAFCRGYPQYIHANLHDTYHLQQESYEGGRTFWPTLIFVLPTIHCDSEFANLLVGKVFNITDNVQGVSK